MSKPIAESALPPNLFWQWEKPHDDYRVHLAFSVPLEGRSFRLLQFPDGSKMFSELAYEGAK